MLIKLQPEQVSLFWEPIKVAILKANSTIPAELQAEFLNSTLGDLLSGKAQVWVTYEGDAENRVIYGINVTCVMVDPIFKVTYLLAHSAYAFRSPKQEHVNEAYAAFAEFGRANKCVKFVASTFDENLTKLYTFMGLKQEVFIYSQAL